jgi:hypothetical protein
MLWVSGAFALSNKRLYLSAAAVTSKQVGRSRRGRRT